jgi:dGTPase
MMNENINLNALKQGSATPENSKWKQMIARKKPLYTANTEIRSEFERDYTRIIYSNAFKRMKHKTQVFFSPTNDHICTRIEHVNYVESISYGLAKALGLNIELTKTIAIAHDLGHSPFGHAGERVLNKILLDETGKTFLTIF